jgi:hypothetical protein
MPDLIITSAVTQAELETRYGALLVIPKNDGSTVMKLRKEIQRDFGAKKVTCIEVIRQRHGLESHARLGMHKCHMHMAGDQKHTQKVT